MATLVVLAFKNEDGASTTLHKVEELQRQHLVEVEDAAVAVHPLKGKVKVHQVQSLVGPGALGGAFWGMLFGLIFFVPFIGLAVGAAAGALLGKSTDIGVDDSFIKNVSKELKPGTSAIFLLLEHVESDKAIAALKPLGASVIHTSMSTKQEQELKAALAS